MSNNSQSAQDDKFLQTKGVYNFFKQIDESIIDFWKQNKVFEKSIESRPKNNQFVFFDGPPFVTGTPHYGHLLVSAIKDMVARYQTMLGKRVERQWGWDCHGIYVEQKVEEKLGIKNRAEIGTKISEEEFIQACYDFVSNVSGKWPWYIDHIGRWADLKNAYWTLDKKYMESVIWAFKQIYDKGYVYKGKKVLMHCPRCVTPISKFEIAMSNSYKDLEDPSIIIKMKVVDKQNTYLLVWTTTPWTLPENVAVAVDKNKTYVTVKFENNYYILAKARLEHVFKDKKYEVIDEYKGEELIGLSYEPLFDYFKNQATDKDFKVYGADFVSMEEGTGLVHMAPAYGEDDYVLSQKYGFSVFEGVDELGKFYDIVKDYKGQFFKDADKNIIKDLDKKGLLFENATIKHSYPVCHRCGTPLMYRATDSYFINLKDHKKELLEQAEKINWVPKHLKHGRFKYILESAPDWNITRTRYWSVPIPIWKCDKCGHEIAVGSIKEIEERSGKKVTDLHRPYIDKHIFTCEKCGGTMHRVEDVIDVWFESGSMPYGSRHYPFENKKEFENHFPADFIVEGIDQTRGWFNALHKISVLLFNKPAFRNVVCHGVILGKDGYKLSKSRKNYPDPEPTLQKYGGDALRLYMLSSAVVQGDSVAFSEKELAGVLRDILIPYLNIFRYFAIYANKSNFKPEEHPKNVLEKGKNLSNILDEWVINVVHKQIKEMRDYLDNYYIMHASRKLRKIVDDISMWYIKRSRDRFVNSDADALNTLFWVLWDVNRAFAPFVPFVTEYIHQELKKIYDKAKLSVHLEYYPELLKNINTELLDNMEIVRKLASLGHKVRVENNLPVKQPLSHAYVNVNLDKYYLELLAQELNIDKTEYLEKDAFDKLDKDYSQGFDSTSNLKIAVNIFVTRDLLKRRLVREIIRSLQIVRKHLKFNLEEYANVQIIYNDDIIKEILEEFANDIKKTTNISKIYEEQVNSVMEHCKKLNQQSFNFKIGPDKIDICVIMSKLNK